jgi:hypothetical protein
MCEKHFVLDDDILESALTCSNSRGEDDETCLEILRAIADKENPHKVVTSRLLRHKYMQCYRKIQKSNSIKNSIVTSLLPNIFVNSRKVIDLKDSTIKNGGLGDCENIIVNLAVDDTNAILITQNDTLFGKVSSLSPQPRIVQPLEALSIVQSD